MAVLLMPVVAVAQEWRVYTYPDPGFTVQSFPGRLRSRRARLRMLPARHCR